MRIYCLTNRWIVLVVSTVAKVDDNINVLSGGEFQAAINKVMANASDWKAIDKIKALRLTHLKAAREFESDLDKVESYFPQPLQVHRHMTGIGGTPFIGGPSTDYVHHCYLELAKPMENGYSYEFKVLNKPFVITYDDSKIVSRAIKVNQVGYLKDSTSNYAYFGGHIFGHGHLPLEGSVFQVISKGSVIAERAIQPHDCDLENLTGENTYQLDLNGLEVEGQCHIRIPNVGISWPFLYSNDAYNECFYKTVRGMYHQRCGMAITRSAWSRSSCHNGDVYESENINFLPATDMPKDYKRFDVIGATTDRTKITKGPKGGHHDAADWDNINTHYACIFDMLHAYEMNPDNFTDNQLHIPESMNGIPDIIDEAMYGARAWARSMNSKGGATSQIETWTHPPISGNFDYCYGHRTRLDSLLFAAAAAQISRLIQKFDPAKATTWKLQAEKAYRFGTDPRNSLGKLTINAKTNRGTGTPYTFEWEEKEEHIYPYLILAKSKMFQLNRDKRYIEGIEELFPKVLKPFMHPYSFRDLSPWLYYSAVQDPDILNATTRTKYLNAFYLSIANSLVTFEKTMPYRAPWKRQQTVYMGWGNTCMANYGRCLLIAHSLTKDEKYKQAAINAMNFDLGANPMGMTMTTGVGQVYPINIQHEISQNDGIIDPVPGITLYGLTGGIHRDLKDSVWSGKEYNVPVWRRWSCHPHSNTMQCEFTIHETMSAVMFCSGYLMSKGWKPSKELIAMKPRKVEDLHGLYFLP